MPDDWEWLVGNWDACYRATAWNIETGLYQEGKGYSGEACITLNVLEVIYGPPLDKLPVWFTSKWGLFFVGGEAALSLDVTDLKELRAAAENKKYRL